MALVQFRDVAKGVSVTRRMFPPARKTDQLSAWWKAVRLAIPIVPQGDDPHGWMFESTEITPRWITWKLKHFATGERCSVIIDRSQPSIG